MAYIIAVKVVNEGYKTLLLTTYPVDYIGKVLDKFIYDNSVTVDECSNLHAEKATTSFFRNRRNMQEKYIGEIKDNFNNSEVVRVPMYDKEIKGIDMLTKIGNNIF